MIWKVRVLTGPNYVGVKVKIDMDHVPLGIHRGQLVQFDIVDLGDQGLVAIHVIVAEQQQPDSQRMGKP